MTIITIGHHCFADYVVEPLFYNLGEPCVVLGLRTTIDSMAYGALIALLSKQL